MSSPVKIMGDLGTSPDVMISHDAQKPFLVYGPGVGVYVDDSVQAHQILTGLIMVQQARSRRSVVDPRHPAPDCQSPNICGLRDTLDEAEALARKLIDQALRDEAARRHHEKQTNHYRVSAEICGLDPDGPHPYEQPPGDPPPSGNPWLDARRAAIDAGEDYD